MPARGLLNEGTSRDGDRDNERPLDSWSFGQHYLVYHIYDQVHGLSAPWHGAQQIGPQFTSKQPFINLQKYSIGPKILVSNFENSVVSSSEQLSTQGREKWMSVRGVVRWSGEED